MVNFVHWHADELDVDYRLPKGTRLVTGCPVWGEGYLSYFLHYCLPSIWSKHNRAALERNGWRIVLFTDYAGECRLNHVLSGSILPYVIVRRLPEAVMKVLHADGTAKYPLLAATQNLLVQKAAEVGAGFHMLVCDTVYSDRYFPGFFGLAAMHHGIAHLGLCARVEQVLPILDTMYRTQDGELSVPAWHLGDLSADHVVAHWANWSMNDMPEDEMPRCHLIFWRTRDAIRMHSPHQSAIWISPDQCKLVTKELGGTLDSELPRYVGSDFCTPRRESGMVIMPFGEEVTPAPHCSFDVYRKEFWSYIGNNRAFLPFFETPTRIPVRYDERYPTDEEVSERFSRFMTRLGA